MNKKQEKTGQRNEDSYSEIYSESFQNELTAKMKDPNIKQIFKTKRSYIKVEQQKRDDLIRVVES